MQKKQKKRYCCVDWTFEDFAIVLIIIQDPNNFSPSPKSVQIEDFGMVRFYTKISSLNVICFE